MNEAFLSLGGNLGDRKAIIDTAVARLCQLPGTRVAGRSSYYRTSPVGPVTQDWFLNIAVALRTELPQGALQGACRAIEAALGRDRSREIPWGPRAVDIDVIAIAGEHGRSDRTLADGYVIVPLAEIAPDLTIAGRTISAYLAEADTSGVELLDWSIPPLAGR